MILSWFITPFILHNLIHCYDTILISAALNQFAINFLFDAYIQTYSRMTNERKNWNKWVEKPNESRCCTMKMKSYAVSLWKTFFHYRFNLSSICTYNPHSVKLHLQPTWASYLGLLLSLPRASHCGQLSGLSRPAHASISCCDVTFPSRAVGLSRQPEKSVACSFTTSPGSPAEDVFFFFFKCRVINNALSKILPGKPLWEMAFWIFHVWLPFRMRWLFKMWCFSFLRKVQI